MTSRSPANSGAATAVAVAQNTPRADGQSGSSTPDSATEPRSPGTGAMTVAGARAGARTGRAVRGLHTGELAPPGAPPAAPHTRAARPAGAVGPAPPHTAQAAAT
ncbi:hypothetical protein ACFVZX_03890, partial [Streptomyces erythrochromogenes]